MILKDDFALHIHTRLEKNFLINIFLEKSYLIIFSLKIKKKSHRIFFYFLMWLKKITKFNYVFCFLAIPENF